MLGLFYSIREKRMMSEGLYRQVLDKYNYTKPNQRDSYNLVMALSFYGNMLKESNPNRTSEATEYLQHSNEMKARLPRVRLFENMYMPKFELE